MNILYQKLFYYKFSYINITFVLILFMNIYIMFLLTLFNFYYTFCTGKIGAHYVFKFENSRFFIAVNGVWWLEHLPHRSQNHFVTHCLVNGVNESQNMSAMIHLTEFTRLLLSIQQDRNGIICHSLQSLFKMYVAKQFLKSCRCSS